MTTRRTSYQPRLMPDLQQCTEDLCAEIRVAINDLTIAMRQFEKSLDKTWKDYSTWEDRGNQLLLVERYIEPATSFGILAAYVNAYRIAALQRSSSESAVIDRIVKEAMELLENAAEVLGEEIKMGFYRSTLSGLYQRHPKTY